MSTMRQLCIATMVALIRWYQVILSPLKGPSCRFTPTCSQYAIEVIRRDGPLLGSIRTVCRLCRCHPWHPGGYDPP